MADVNNNNLKPRETFVDENGVEQTVVSLDQIFGMISPKPRQNPNPPPNPGKRKPNIKRGIKI